MVRAHIVGRIEMGRELSEESDACLADVRAHIRQFGATNWSAVREKHPKIQDRTFWRIVKKAKASPSFRSREVQTAMATMREVASMLPAEALSVGPPAAVRKTTKEAANCLNLQAELRDMMADSEKIRDFALGAPDENGDRKVKNPLIFAKAVSLKRDLVESLVKTWTASFDTRRMQEFYDVVIDEIGRASPEVQSDIVQRLGALIQENGVELGR
jgi:hypothetical protein